MATDGFDRNPLVRDDAHVGGLTRNIVAATALLAVFASPVATCLAGTVAAHAKEMACCMDGDHDCGTAMKATDCCAVTPTTPPQQLSASKTESVQRQLFHAPLVWYPAAIPAPVPILVTDLSRALRTSIDTGPPDCITFAVLLI